MSPTTAAIGLHWTPEQAALVLGPHADPDLIRGLVELLGLPEIEPGRWDAADLTGLHVAVLPWAARRRMLPPTG